MTRATRADWLQKALAILDEEGPRALTIERLCAAMHKTKGGFYHHFGDAAGLQRAILDQWEAAQTTAVIEAVEREDREAQLEALDRIAAAADWGQERAIRAWAWHDSLVRARVEAIDARRIAYLASLYPSGSRALRNRLALLEYAALVGAQHLFHSGTAPGRRPGLGRLLRQALTAVSEHNE